MRITALLLIAAFAGCQRHDTPNDAAAVPECIERKISDFIPEACKEGANVTEYAFQGVAVYVFDPGTCGADMTSEVLDASCKTLGYLGGFTGNTQINGEDFSTAQEVRVIWRVKDS